MSNHNGPVYAMWMVEMNNTIATKYETNTIIGSTKERYRNCIKCIATHVKKQTPGQQTLRMNNIENSTDGQTSNYTTTKTNFDHGFAKIEKK